MRVLIVTVLIALTGVAMAAEEPAAPVPVAPAAETVSGTEAVSVEPLMSPAEPAPLLLGGGGPCPAICLASLYCGDCQGEPVYVQCAGCVSCGTFTGVRKGVICDGERTYCPICTDPL